MIGYHTTSLDNWESIQDDGFLWPTPIKRERILTHYSFHVPQWIRRIYSPERFKRQFKIPRLRKKLIYHDLMLSKFTGKNEAIWVFSKPFEDLADLKYRIVFNFMKSPTICFELVDLEITYPKEQSLTRIVEETGGTVHLTHTATGAITLDTDQEHPIENCYHRVSFDLITEPVPVENIRVRNTWKIIHNEDI